MLKNIDNWDKIPIDTYKDIIEEAKQRYAELMSQSQDITSKIQKIIVSISVLVSWFANFLFTNEFCYKTYISIFFALFTVIVYYKLISMLAPRGVQKNGGKSDTIQLLGTGVSDSLEQEEELNGLEDGYNDEKKFHVYLFLKAWRYKKRIENFSPVVDGRAIKYRATLICSLILFLYIVASVLFIRL